MEADGEYRSVWTLAEERGGRLRSVSYELLARGRRLADARRTELVSVVLGGELSEDALLELIRRGADRVLAVLDARLGDFIVETHSNVLCTLIRERRPEIVLAAATLNGRTLMPHAAMRLHAGLTADCTELAIEEGTGDLLQTRPAIGGNILATIKSPKHRPQMATVRPRSARAPQADPGRQGTVERLPFRGEWLDGRVRKLEERVQQDEETGIQEADIVVAGGRGMKKAENFALLGRLAGALGGTVGASRDAVDRGWARYPRQVGLSGKTVTPKLYFAAGISGAIQHLAGMKTAECIVAVNASEDAPIFQVADFGIVADLFEVLPRLSERLEKETPP